MKYAQRMVLVPEGEYKKHKKSPLDTKKKRKKNRRHIVKPCKKLRDVKHKLNFLSIPARKVYKQHREAVKASQGIAKLTLAPKDKELTTHLEVFQPHTLDDGADKKQDATPTILKTIPMQHMARAKKILDMLMKYGFNIQQRNGYNCRQEK